MLLMCMAGLSQQQRPQLRRRAWVWPRPQIWFCLLIAHTALHFLWKEHFHVSHETFEYLCDLVSWVTRKCSFQRKCSAVWAIRRQNQFCGRGQTQALLLSCALCCCESPAIHISNIRRFLLLILKASYIKAKQYICWSAKDRCRKIREAKIKIRHAIWTFRGRMVKVWVSCYLLCRVVSIRK